MRVAMLVVAVLVSALLLYAVRSAGGQATAPGAAGVQLPPASRCEACPLETLVLQPRVAQCEKTVLLVHGCSRNGRDWFEYPEEKLIVRAFLDAGWCAVAISSSDRTASKCWSRKRDLGPTQRSVAALSQHFGHQKWKKRLCTFGASSGGTFVQELASSPYEPPIAQVVVMIAPATPPLLSSSHISHVAIVYMARDNRWATREAAEEAAAELKSKKVLVVESPHMRLTQDMARVRGLNWERALPLLDATERAEVPSDPHLEETLRMCQAEHEMTAHRIDDIVRFLDSV
jgi:hypothetical protein